MQAVHTQISLHMAFAGQHLHALTTKTRQHLDIGIHMPSFNMSLLAKTISLVSPFSSAAIFISCVTTS